METYEIVLWSIGGIILYLSCIFAAGTVIYQVCKERFVITLLSIFWPITLTTCLILMILHGLRVINLKNNK